MSRRRPWAIPALLFGLVLAVFAAPVAAFADTDGGEDTPAGALVEPNRVLPDVVVVVPDRATAAEDTAALVGELQREPAIAWAAEDQLAAGGHRVLVAFVDDEAEVGPRAVAAAVSAMEDPTGVAIAGREVSDRALGDRLGTGVFLAVALAAIAVAALGAWTMGLLRGAIAGFTLAIGGWLGGILGSGAAGRFDGSLASTSVPAVMAAVIVAAFLLVRLFQWFENPQGDDQADMIRRSVLSVGVELLLAFAGLIVTALFLEVVGSTRSVATVALVGALTAALLTLAVVPSALAALHGAGASIPDDGGVVESRFGPLPLPSGREFPVFVLVGFGLFLGLLALFSLGSTGRGQLLDERSLGDDSQAVVGTKALLERGGDPTSAIFARFPDGTDQLAKQAWLERVSELPSVGRVDTSTGRFQDGVFTAMEGLVPVLDQISDPADGEVVASGENPRYALVVPDVTGRSERAIDLVASIESINAPVNAELDGVPVEAGVAEGVGRLWVWMTILILAAVAAATVFALIGDLGLAGLAGALRLLELAAVAGVYRLLVGAATGVEIQLAVLLVALAVGLFELGYLRRLLASHRVEDTDLLLDDALQLEGLAGAVGLALAAVAAFGFLFPDLALLRRFGILLALVILIETVVGAWLLRPAVLGTRAIGHFASKPVRAALQAMGGESVVGEAEHKAWVEVVSNLLWAEFLFQSEPATATIDNVFVAETPLHRKSVEHHDNLAAAGLRIVGRQAQIRALRVVDNASPATVVVTVDHPVRQLIGSDGKVVGVRKAERRTVMLWLAIQHDGSYRIVDSVELGSAPLGVAEESVAPVPATASASAK